VNLKSFNSKRYALAVFMSICLFAGTSLPIEVKAEPIEIRANSFETLKTKAAEWRKDNRVFDMNKAAQELEVRFDFEGLKSKDDEEIRNKEESY